MRIWTLPESFYAAARDALRLRARLLPYLYTASRAAFDSGRGVLRAMYMDYPEQDPAYWGSSQGAFPQVGAHTRVLARSRVGMGCRD